MPAAAIATRRTVISWSVREPRTRRGRRSRHRAGEHACGAERMEPVGVDRAHSRFPGHALTPTGVMAIRCKQFHLPDL